ncbi:unnamed protein product [Cyclocybe aegerita]|uniref:Copper-fist domain-containing protein n=1 Tax=Cyclocybe aegerita TaxID=1973307 RepID=A0A8S0WHW6_CYCAE|nr:unnamed protein product [Cyclocybe aegerita]
MIISSKKYACETCIKGHRSSACKHTDRPLFEIKKKGRPVTQCEHCRELRKTKQVHVKCICETKADFPAQGHKQGFESAAFPNGLPEALEASVAFHNPDSDSDHGGHRCKAGDVCHCVTPRTRVRKRGDSDSVAASGHPSSSQILARIAELRPVLPRPSGPVHSPSTGTSHGHGGRHHDAAFNPYERAYGMTHQHPVHPQSYAGTSNPASSYNAQSFAEPWTQNVALDDAGFPSLCGCGDDCNCPGCMHHNRSTAVPLATAYASCTNPGGCSACLDCTIMSLPPSAFLPPNTALSIYDSQNDSIDEWLRQLSSTSFSDPSQPSLQQDFSTSSNFQQQTVPSQGWAMAGDAQNTMPPANFLYESSAMPNMTPFATSNMRSDFSPQPQTNLSAVIVHEPPCPVSTPVR